MKLELKIVFCSDKNKDLDIKYKYLTEYQGSVGADILNKGIILDTTKDYLETLDPLCNSIKSLYLDSLILGDKNIGNFKLYFKGYDLLEKLTSYYLEGDRLRDWLITELREVIELRFELGLPKLNRKSTVNLSTKRNSNFNIHYHDANNCSGVGLNFTYTIGKNKDYTGSEVKRVEVHLSRIDYGEEYKDWAIRRIKELIPRHLERISDNLRTLG